MLKHQKIQASKLKKSALSLVLTLGLITTSCSTTDKNISATKTKPPTDALKTQSGLKPNTPKGLINGLDDETNSSQSETTSKITSFDQLDSMSETLTWGDGENANQLANLNSKQPLNNGWHLSFNQALQESRRQQKPLFIWCTNSASGLSPNSTKLYDELIKQNDFNQWVLANFTALKLDRNIQESDNALFSKKQKHMQQLLHQLNVGTYPTILIYTPESNLIGRHNYVNTSANYLRKELKRNLKLAQDLIQKTQQREMRNGFRFWNLNNLGYPLFARMTRYQAGTINLETLSQENFTIKTEEISNEDYHWLQLQRVKSK